MDARSDFHADFGLGTDGGLQRQVWSAAIGAIGQFRLGRRFEPLADIAVDIDRIARMPHEAEHRAGMAVIDLAAVVRTGGGEVMVGDGKPDLAGTHAGDGLPGRREAPVDLAEDIDVAHAAVFIAAQIAAAAGIIHEAPPPLVLLPGFDADRGLQRHVVDFRLARPAGGATVIVAVQIDHAARRCRCSAAEGQCLIDLAIARIHAGADRIGSGEAVIEHEACLVLPDRLARVEAQGGGNHLPRIVLEIRPVQAERILRDRQIEDIQDTGDRGIVR